MSNENEENDILLKEPEILKPIVGTFQNMFNLKCDIPGNTLLVCDLQENTNENELLNFFKVYGSASQVFIHNNTALLEFDSISTVSNLLSSSKTNPIKFKDKVINVSFSCQSIDECKSLFTPNLNRSSQTKVLHFIITNALYDISISVLEQICLPYGQIVRICIGRKNTSENTIDALVEFNSESNAKLVKEKLDGMDIYSNCCSLMISYSKVYKVKVLKNDGFSFDFSINTKSDTRKPLVEYSSLSDNNASKSKNKPTSMLYYKSDATFHETVEGVVLECKNFSSKLKADNFFNLFCLYGNVVKVKLAKEKAKVALIQMSNCEGADFCKEMYDGLRIFNKNLEITTTKLTQLTDSSPTDDPVTSYVNDVNNRFKSTFQGRARAYRPSETLYFSNVPSSFLASEIADVFISAKVKGPRQVIIHPLKKIGATHSRITLINGLIEFDTVDEALEAVLVVNHKGLLVPGINHPYNIKLSFFSGNVSEYAHSVKRSADEVDNNSHYGGAKRCRYE